MKTIYIGGSAANPPHLGHLAMIKLMLICLKGNFEVIWIPSGIRPDKPNLANAHDRKIMTDLLFESVTDPRFHIDYTDLEAGENRPTIQILQQLELDHPENKYIWYTGVDSVVPQKKFGGLGEIEAVWHRGKKLMQMHEFLILPRPHYTNPHSLHLPEQFKILDCEGLDSELLDRSSSEIVSRIQSGKPWEHLYGEPDNPIVGYIKSHHLYGWKG